MREYDLVVVGSGAAGMTAALTAAHHGLDPLLVEKSDRYGGSTARSGGSVWIPGNQVLGQAGVTDTPEDARRYLAHVVGDGSPQANQRAFLEHGPAMLSFVLEHTPLRFSWVPGHTDHYPEAPGGLTAGRSVEPSPFDSRVLGAERDRLQPPYPSTPSGRISATQADQPWLNLIARNPLGLWHSTQVRLRRYAARARGGEPLTMGRALAAGLRAGLADAGVPVWLGTPLTSLVRDGERVTGVTVLRDGEPLTVRARYGVVLASGGFDHHEQLRRKHQRTLVGVGWTVGVPDNTGDGILAGITAGAATDLMGEAWWGPALQLPHGPYFCVAERALPGCLMVDGDGVRFGNEAAPPLDAVRAMHQGGPARHLPTWLLFDQRYRDRYPFAGLAPREPFPSQWHSHDVVRRAATVPALAQRIGVPADALCATVDRFNEYARAGTDPDFGRGVSAYDRYFGDPWNAPNPCLGELRQTPFYAVRVFPGDLGTKGGLRTDADARVLRPDNSPIPGLYAAGNTAAPVMGRAYPGPGAAIGSAMTFGYLAGLHVAARHREASGNPVG